MATPGGRRSLGAAAPDGDNVYLPRLQGTAALLWGSISAFGFDRDRLSTHPSTLPFSAPDLRHCPPGLSLANAGDTLSIARRIPEKAAGVL